MNDIPLCRTATYYVNPLSISNAELGTRDHPYKEFESVIVEIMNYLSHEGLNITIYVMEKSTIFANSPVHIINATNVHIESYSEVRTNPEKAKLVIVQTETKIVQYSMSNKFTILLDKEQRRDERIYARTFPEDELFILVVNNACFNPYLTGLTFKNFRVASDYLDLRPEHTFLEPLRVDDKEVALIDCDIKMGGTLMLSDSTAFNWIMTDVNIDISMLWRLSRLTLFCGETGTTLDTKVHFKNVNMYTSDAKPVLNQRQQTFIQNYFPQDFIMEDVYMDTYQGYDFESSHSFTYISDEK